MYTFGRATRRCGSRIRFRSVSHTNKQKTQPSSSSSSWWQRFTSYWDQHSGTSEIEILKRQVTLKSQAFDTAQQQVAEARKHLDQTLLQSVSITTRHGDLLRTRDQWTTTDANLFAQTLADEVKIRQELQAARETTAAVEMRLSHAQLEYMDSMRRRYHEEQVWQDKWRVLSTYGTWSLIVLNSAVFLLSQVFNHRREFLRIKAIESLINEKIPDPQPESKNENKNTEDEMVEHNQKDDTVNLAVNSADNNPDARNEAEDTIEDGANTNKTDSSEQTHRASGISLLRVSLNKEIVFKAIQSMDVGVLRQKSSILFTNLLEGFDLPSALFGVFAACLSIMSFHLLLTT